MKLNRWQRIGVVLSVVWALGAAYYERSSQMESGQKWMEISSQSCHDSNALAINPPKKDCSKEWEKDFQMFMTPNWEVIAFISIAPIPIGWGVAFLLIRIYRWVKAGTV